MGRYIAKEVGKDISELPYAVLSSEELRKEFGQATFFTATDGNHGRGVAWAAKRLGQKAVVMDCDVLAARGRLKGKEKPFDFIFMDPPYNKNFEFHVLDELRQMDYVDDHTVIIVEASKETSFDYLDQFGYEMIKRKEYKTNMHIFIQKK